MVSRELGIVLRLRRTSGVASSSAYTPQSQSEAGPQLFMIYFGSSGCAGANRPDLPEAVEVLKLRLEGVAEREHVSFVSIGVALDWNSEKGLQHLGKFGRFDEVSAGHGWANTLGLEYMWSEPSVTVATPQVLVYRRFLAVSQDSTAPPRYDQTDLEFVAAAAGADRIIDWAHSGAAFPTTRLHRAGSPREG